MNLLARRVTGTLAMVAALGMVASGRAPMPMASPESVGLSTAGLQAYGQALQEIARLGRGLEQRAGYHFETHVGERRGDDVGAAIVAVLTHLGDEDARLPPHALADRGDALDRAVPAGVVLMRGTIDAGDRGDADRVAAERGLHRRRHLAQGAAGARRPGPQYRPR